MQSRIRHLVIWMLAFLVPIQGFAAVLGHCGQVPSHRAAEISSLVADAGQPCPLHAVNRDGTPSHQTDDHATHGGACAACCAVPVPQVNLVAASMAVVTDFPHPLDRIAQFIPSGLKRPPSEI